MSRLLPERIEVPDGVPEREWVRWWVSQQLRGHGLSGTQLQEVKHRGVRFEEEPVLGGLFAHVTIPPIVRVPGPGYAGGEERVIVLRPC